MSNKILKLPETMSLSGLTRSSMYVMAREGNFPQQVKLNKRSVGWLEHEVQDWVDKRVAERDTGAKVFSSVGE